MKSSGNGLPQLCLVNLFRMTRGEVRFDVLRGMDSSITDKPETAARPVADCGRVLAGRPV